MESGSLEHMELRGKVNFAMEMGWPLTRCKENDSTWGKRLGKKP